MARLLIIGCGGVAGVAIAKCCQNSEVFTDICIASRTVSKCEAVKENLHHILRQELQQLKLTQIMLKNLLHLLKSMDQRQFLMWHCLIRILQ